MMGLRNFQTAAMIGLSLLCICPNAMPYEFSLKVNAGAAWLDGGDLNASIEGWKSFYEDRNNPSFSSSFGLKELRGIFEVQAELAVRFSPRWSAGLSVGYIPGTTSGEVSSLLSEETAYTLASGDGGTIAITEESTRPLRYDLRAVPVLLTVYWSFPLRDHLQLTLGAGGGMYLGQYEYLEEYGYILDYRDTQNTPGGPVQYVDLYELAGEYREKASARALGAHGLVGLDYQISSSLAVIIEVVGRWARLDDWRGEKTDAYEWSQTWGFDGAFSEEGEAEESAEGKLWRADARGETDTRAYPRLVFGAEAPASLSYSNVRPARIGFSGVSARIGFRFRFGERR